MRNDRMQEGSTAVALAMVTPGYDQDPASGVADYQASHQDQAQFEADKRAVYKHPLFPLLALLFERCEQATQSSDNSTSESFNMDIQAFVQHQERDRKPFLVNDPEIDGLMIKAIQVLRIHLLELEKVQELCKDFCNRYITCLKGKMQSENLLRSDYGHHGGGHDGLAPSSGSNGSSPLQVLSSTGNDVEPGANGLRVSRAGPEGPSDNGVGAGVGLQQLRNNHHHLTDDYDRPSSTRSSSSGGNFGASGGTGYDDEHAQPGSPGGTVHGGTPLSQIGAQSVTDIYLGQDYDDPLCSIYDGIYVEDANNWVLYDLQESKNEFEFMGVAGVPSKKNYSGSPSSMQSDDEDDTNGIAAAAGVGSLSSRKPKPKRGVLPKLATNIMRAWLFQHLVHPYPTEDEKRQIANETNLTLLQVNNWFINARRRILQPMLDAAVSGDPLRVPTASAGNSGITKHQRSKTVVRNISGKSHQSDWQSEDSGSESNGLSDGDAAFSAMSSVDRQRIDGDGEDSEDGGIDTEENKPFNH